MVVDGGREVLGVKPMVMATFGFPTILSEGLIANDVEVIKKAPEPKMDPESTDNDGRTSSEVCTTQREPAVTVPMVKPEIVTVNKVAGILAPAVVITMNGAVVLLHIPVRPCTLLLPTSTFGVTDGAKKAEGYVSVIVPPIGMGVNGVKESVTGTLVLPSVL